MARASVDHLADGSAVDNEVQEVCLRMTRDVAIQQGVDLGCRHQGQLTLARPISIGLVMP
jgi:hypothetical protein